MRSFIRPICLVTLVCGGALSAHSAPLFENGAVVHQLPAPPTDVEVGDVDADGRTDVFVSHSSTGNVSVLHGNGDGSLQLMQQIATGFGPATLSVGDVDGNGHTDALCTNRGGGSVWLTLLSSQPNGVFAQMLQVPTLPVVGRLGDLDGDLKLDAIVLLAQNPQIGWLRGHGDGTFDDYATLAPVSSAATDMDLADLDRNGHLDIILLQSDFKVTVAFGNGAGGLSSVVSYNIPASQPSPNPMRLRSLPDGSTEIWVWYVNPGGSTPAYIVGRWAPSNLTFTVETSPPLSSSFRFIDVSGDDWPDLVTESAIHLGSQSSPAGPANPIFGGGGSAAADMNGDGHADLIGKTCQAVTISLLFPIDATTIHTGLGTSYDGPRARYAFHDFDEDGHADAATVSAGEIWLWHGATDGTFGAPLRQATTASVPNGDFDLGDVNGDGRKDLICRVGNLNFQVIPNLAGTAFGTPVTTPAPSSPSSFAVGDVNDDGREDVVARNSASFEVFFGNANGSLTAGTSYTIPASRDLLLGDIDNDGVLDVVVTYQAGTVSWWRGKKNGTFLTGVDIGTPQPTALTLGDLDEDGFQDAIIGSQGRVLWLRNGGAGTFQAAQDAIVGPSATSFVNQVSLQDVDLDGHLDLFYRMPTCGIHVALGHGDGTFAHEGNYLRGHPHRPQVFLLDADPWPDMIFGFDPATTPPVGAFAVLRGLSETFFITASASDGGAISPGGLVVTRAGQDRTFLIVPEPNHVIGDVKVDGVSVGAISSYMFPAVSANHTILASFAPIVGVGDVPATLRLLPVVPTPSRGHARIRFAVPRRGHATLEVLDLAGRRVTMLARGELGAGWHERTWNGGWTSGRPAPAGIYLVRLRVADGDEVRRVIWTP